MREIYTVRYSNGDKKIRIQVISYLSEDIQNHEVENDSLEIYIHNGIDYYFFKNVDQHRVFWTVDSYECDISGDVSIGELKMMIDSIQKGK